MKISKLVVMMCASALIVVSAAGCGADSEKPSGTQATANAESCGGDDCHDDRLTAMAEGTHAAVACAACHKDTGDSHAAEPKKAIAETDWTIAACAECHSGEADTYLYDDNAQLGPFGGSRREPPQSKLDTFPEYDKIVAGHPFTKGYLEEGAHKYMLQDHYETPRGKFETCLQCKSSKLAYAWKEGKPLRVMKDENVTLTHTAAPGVEASVVTIPQGTVITYKTDPASRQVDARVKMPDGTAYSSRPAESEDATQNYNMVWASTIAGIKDTWPYGAGCNHCHDPHTGSLRYLRQAMLQAIEGDGGVKGEGGVNPYQEGSPKDVEEASAKDRRILSCAQCHVEYVCGKSSVDGIDRDGFGWAKATDLHELYKESFDYKQDWKHGIIGQPLIKSQHPETEFYWNSVHYDAGVACGDCHMPEVTKDGRTFKSHWFTSPYKYRDVNTSAAFAEATGLDTGGGLNPCTRCHEDRTERAISQQTTFYQAQAEVEKLLSQSVTQLGAAKTSGKASGETYVKALEAHQKAHVIWENLAVSENSMGFHNFDEAMSAMASAKEFVTEALAAEKTLLGTQ